MSARTRKVEWVYFQGKSPFSYMKEIASPDPLWISLLFHPRKQRGSHKIVKMAEKMEVKPFILRGMDILSGEATLLFSVLPPISLGVNS